MQRDFLSLSFFTSYESLLSKNNDFLNPKELSSDVIKWVYFTNAYLCLVTLGSRG